MASHFKNLQASVPDLIQRHILDIGSGGGEFVIEAALAGARVSGIEKKTRNVEKTYELARQKGVTVDVREGLGEAIPFPDNTFDFANLCELIEHVENPRKLLEETKRVLNQGGLAYVSVPNRFGIKDQHFGLYFLNWMPRSWAHRYVGLRGRHKNYDGSSGYQRIDQMHYYTLSGVMKLIQSVGLSAEDIRLKKINRFKNPVKRVVALGVYSVLKHFYFDSFHLLLKK